MKVPMEYLMPVRKPNTRMARVRLANDLARQAFSSKASIDRYHIVWILKGADWTP